MQAPGTEKHSIDFEEHRQDNIEVPLFELEQRVDEIESKLASLQTGEHVGQMLEKIAYNMNSNSATYLPKISKQIKNLE